LQHLGPATPSSTSLLSSTRPPPGPTLFPYTTLFRSHRWAGRRASRTSSPLGRTRRAGARRRRRTPRRTARRRRRCAAASSRGRRSEEHTSELQSRENLVCRLLLEKKNNSILSRLIGG